MHPVLAALRQRPPDARLALVVEGGGMRGAVTGGMALALDELGLAHSFDAVYGASAGALNALWLVSGRAGHGIRTWTDAGWLATLIRRRRLLRRRPVIDVDGLVLRRYETLSPGLYEALLAAPTEFHPLATDVATGRAVDLHPEIRDVATLRTALRASSMLPLLAGPPVALGGRRLLDAGLSAAIPIRAALADAATHVLVLRSRRAGETTLPPRGARARLTARMLARIDPQVALAWTARAPAELEDEALLERHMADPTLTPHILQLRPAPGSPVPGRLERDIGVVAGGFEAGLRAAREALAPLAGVVAD
ncbi:MAG TPA: patatin-like phospholipase family protein [Solirubrobacteraceae bacterium]|nr:patatin-like phospholipase family protein [Solirubrobacteraceae bacterium]